MLISDYINKLEDEGLLIKYEANADLSKASSSNGSEYKNSNVDRVAKHIGFNSSTLGADSVFVCKGVHFKREYLQDAISKGALAYVSEEDYGNQGISSIIVKDVRKAMTALALCFYGDVSKKIKIIGITGTKGKTSSVYYTKGILDEYENSNGGKAVGLSSGIVNYDGTDEVEADLTTPETLDMYRLLSDAVENELEFFALECSSQALKYGRVDGIEFEVAVFNNIGLDHISPKEHPSYEDYLESKLRIFEHARTAVYNLDCDSQDRISETARAVDKCITFSIKDKSANVYAYNMKSDHGKVSFDVAVRDVCEYPDCDFYVELASFGLINVPNALSATAIAVALGIPTDNIIEGLSKVKIPGRMELITSPSGRLRGIVDYAHNELSLATLCKTIREEFPGYKLITLFGAAGGKAFVRREGLGRASAKYADYTIVTEDDPGEEDVMSICNEIASYIEAEGGKYEIFPDREDAVRRAVELADEKTILLLLGKGDEAFIKRGLKSIPARTDAEKLISAFENK